MAAGLAALLDDIAAFARLAAASIDDVGAAAGRASAKAAGVIIDDAAVTPRYVEGLAAERELPIVKRIALGSIRNKIVFILPVILLLSEFLPWLLTPLLMCGGTYLAYEGAEKIWEWMSGHAGHASHAADASHAAQDSVTGHSSSAAQGSSVAQDSGAAQGKGKIDEDKIVRGAVTTDFILSAEIMVIALNEVTNEPLWSRALILVLVALLITALVYGAVGLIVKMDDIGLRLARRDSAFSQRMGRGMVNAMPKVMSVLSTVGIIAMLWVGGHILLAGVDELGWHWLYDQVHHLEEAVGGVAGVGGFLAWVINTLASAVVGLIVGAVVVLIAHLIRKLIPGRAKAAH